MFIVDVICQHNEYHRRRWKDISEARVYVTRFAVVTMRSWGTPVIDMCSIAKLFPEQTAKQASARLLSILSLHFPRYDYNKLVESPIDSDSVITFQISHLFQLYFSVITRENVCFNGTRIDNAMEEKRKFESEQRCGFCLSLVWIEFGRFFLSCASNSFIIHHILTFIAN